MVGRKEEILPLYRGISRVLRCDCLTERQKQVCFGCGLGSYLPTNISVRYPHVLTAGAGLCQRVHEHITLVAIAFAQPVDLYISSLTPTVAPTIPSPSCSPCPYKGKTSKSSWTGTGMVSYFIISTSSCEGYQLKCQRSHFYVTVGTKCQAKDVLCKAPFIFKLPSPSCHQKGSKESWKLYWGVDISINF